MCIEIDEKVVKLIDGGEIYLIRPDGGGFFVYGNVD